MKPDSRFLKILDSVDSTNNYAMAMVHEGLAKHGMGWLALEQSAGKGQRGNQWVSEPGKNIAMSIVIEPSTVGLLSGFHLSAAVAVACFKLISKYAGSETTIKWPNDIYWGDRKAGGILVESIYQGSEWKFAVVGTGLNINSQSFPPELKNPVSLQQATGKEYDLIELADELYQLLMQSIELPFKENLTIYNENLYLRDKETKLKMSNAVFTSTIQKVNEYGQLVTLDTMERCFDFGSIEWVV